jgi:hypothetical protein
MIRVEAIRDRTLAQQRVVRIVASIALLSTALIASPDVAASSPVVTYDYPERPTDARSLQSSSGILLGYNPNSEGPGTLSPYVTVLLDGKAVSDRVYLAYGTTINSKLFFCESLQFGPPIGVCPSLPSDVVPPVRISLITWTGPMALFRNIVVLGTDSISTCESKGRNEK